MNLLRFSKFALAVAGLACMQARAQYNTLVIPTVLTGTTFNLSLNVTNKQFFAGTPTVTYAYNGSPFGGPVLIMNHGDVVQINLTNNLPNTTTTHWHGFHIPAIMDGGPHQTIAPGKSWSPTFTVLNNAATFWFHPHLHQQTQKQLSLGAIGMIIVRDTQEAALALPRTYGVDDIPIAFTSRRFTATNSIITTNCAYGDYLLANGTLNAQVSLPQQFVRLRILNAEVERSYNLGLSDNRNFYVIGTDGGLLNAPVATNRALMAVGERLEILLNLTTNTVGSTLDLMAYNSGQGLGFPGGEAATSGQFGSLLNNTSFTMLHIVVAAATTNPITSLPTALVTNTVWTTNYVVTTNRTINITGGTPGTAFTFDNLAYSPSFINQNLKLDAIEKWTIVNNSPFSHAFHVHDIQFNLISRTGGSGSIAEYEKGWKDTFYSQQNSTVSFIAKFDTFASSTNPFMYHCHFSNHEDEGTMAQFLVATTNVENLAVANVTRIGTNSTITIPFVATTGTTYVLQYSASFTAESWSDIGSVTSDGTTATFNETDTNRLAQSWGYYRVVMPVRNDQ